MVYIQEYEPIYKARQLGAATIPDDQNRQQRRRRRSGPDEDEDPSNLGQQHYDTETNKRFLGLEDQEKNGAKANVNAGYSTMLL
jgi:hypothetical protein